MEIDFVATASSTAIEVTARRGRGARGTEPAAMTPAGPRHCPLRREHFVNRHWSRIGVRVASVGLLVLGVAGGVHLGQGGEAQQQSAEAQFVVQADADEIEMQLLKQRHSQHAAARARQRQAEGDAAAKAAAEAKAAASKARKIEKKAIEAAEEKAAEAAEAKAAAESSGSGPSAPFTGSIPASCDEFSGNRAIGCALMLKDGFDIDQFPCLNKLWTKESNWRTTASNSSSGAYGIPQALPGSKMGSVADDWRTNPATQIKWGLGYIEGRYGSPCEAWSHSQSSGWY